MNQLAPEIYDILKRLARSQRSRVWAKKGLGTRSIVHEAYLRMVESSPGLRKDEDQFLLIASKAMRSVLIDNARHWRRQKRGGDQFDVSIDDLQLVSAQRTDELIELDKALSQLAAENERLASVVECRVFGGLSIDETARVLSVSPATVKRDWASARAILYDTLVDEGPTLPDD